MKHALAGLALIALLAGCGADGPPTRPEAELGATISSDGLAPSGRVGLRRGPVTLSVGF